MDLDEKIINIANSIIMSLWTMKMDKKKIELKDSKSATEIADELLAESISLMESPYKSLTKPLVDKYLNIKTWDDFFEYLYIKLAIIQKDVDYHKNMKKKGVSYAPNKEDKNYIDTSNIKTGAVYKNYRQLCKALNVDPKGGNSKKAQLENFERFFIYEKPENSNQFIIKHIYNVPKPQKKRSSIYQKYIELILLIAMFSSGKLNATTQELIVLLNMAAEKPNKYRDIPQYKEIVQQVNNFCYTTIKRALQSLVDRRLITYHKVLMIDYREATIEEEEIVRKTELELLKKYQKTDIHEIHKIPLLQYQFYSERQKVLYDIYGWRAIYHQHKLISNKQDIRYGIEGVSQELKERLNDECVNHITSSFIEPLIRERDEKIMMLRQAYSISENESTDLIEALYKNELEEYDKKINEKQQFVESVVKGS